MVVHRDAPFTKWFCLVCARLLSLDLLLLTRGDLAVRLPRLVVGPEEETTEVVVQLHSNVETGDIYVGGTGEWDRYF